VKIELHQCVTDRLKTGTAYAIPEDTKIISGTRRQKMKQVMLKRPNKEDGVMKRRWLLLLLVMALVAGMTGFASQSDARVSVGVGINLPAYRFGAAPSLVVIPGTYAYFAPEADVDIVFYSGYWYRPYEGRWYRGRGYNGPWGVVAPARIPRALIELPHDYRRVYREHPRIAYPDFNRQWRNWERNRHWEKDERWREGRRERHEERRDHRQGERGEQRREHRGR
jgi:hypothetical protein